jgi:hypothetical protein
MTDRVDYLSTVTQYRVLDALYDLAIKLPCHRVDGGAVTGLSASPPHFHDATLLAGVPDGLFKNGTLFIWGTGDTPTFIKYRRSYLVVDHTGDRIEFTPAAPTLITTPTYSLFDATFPRTILIQSLGMALRDFGDIPVTREITTVENQEEYDYVDSAQVFTGNQLIKVEVATQMNEPYEYYTHRNWHMGHDAANGNTLRFDPGHVPNGGYKMRLTYWCKHVDVLGHETFEWYTYAVQDGLEIAPILQPERLSWAAAVYALRWKVQRSPEQSSYKEALQEAIQREQQYRMKYPIEKPVTIHLSNWQVGR